MEPPACLVHAPASSGQCAPHVNLLPRSDLTLRSQLLSHPCIMLGIPRCLACVAVISPFSSRRAKIFLCCAPRLRCHAWLPTTTNEIRAMVQCNQALIWTPDCLHLSRSRPCRRDRGGKLSSHSFRLDLSVNPNWAGIEAMRNNDHGWIREKLHSRLEIAACDWIQVSRSLAPRGIP